MTCRVFDTKLNIIHIQNIIVAVTLLRGIFSAFSPNVANILFDTNSPT